VRENIFELRLPGSARNIYTENLTTSEAHQLADCIVFFLRKHNLAETLVLVQFPFWRQVALRLKETLGFPVVYDCMDDWSHWTAEPRISAFALEEEESIAREADVTLATSTELQMRLQTSSGRDVVRLKNGADFEFFRDAPRTELLANIPHPIVGYYGAISDWFDLELVATVAQDRPAYSFVIIGEIHDTDVSLLRKRPNVHLLGEKNYRLIPAYLSEFDVAILPFKMNRLTHAVDPVKVYEYLAQGKPVVATGLPEVCNHGDLVYLGSARNFASQLDRAMSDGTSLAEQRISYAARNSWTDRVSTLKAVVQATYPLISVIILGYNSKDYLQLLLDSLRRNTAYPNYEILVVDNGSEDGSVAFLEVRKPHSEQHIRVFPLHVNTGFAAGNNLGAREARGDYLVFLNADTIVTRGWLYRLIRPLLEHRTIGMSAAVTNFSGNETRIATSYRNVADMDRFAKRLADEKFGETLEVAMAPFQCVALRRHVWEQVGGLDEQFGIGMFEDDDFACRLRRLGYRIVTAEDCFIHHFGHGSFARLAPQESLALFARNKAYFEEKSGQRWVPHQMRPGVDAPTDADRLSPVHFASVTGISPEMPAALGLVRLHPERAMVGHAVNRQPNGSSAIVAECTGATPGTVIKFGAEVLHTAYGSGTLLSAELPADFNTRPSSTPVTLLNHFGSSNTVIFRIEQIERQARGE
jgi:GT2 family glycosyltransferase/glycosyltransferase involved in cell wall biosynthesis